MNSCMFLFLHIFLIFFIQDGLKELNESIIKIQNAI